MGSLKPAVFLDRDGVVIEESHYLADATQVKLVPDAGAAIAALNRAGWVVVIVTNQSGVARGLFPVESVEEVHQHISELLLAFGARIDAFRFCPHHPEAEIPAYRAACDCRKPRPGMLLGAAAEHRIDLTSSWLVGDRPSDLEAGAAAGCRTVLVRTGYGAGVDPASLDREGLRLQLVADNLADAVVRLGLDRGPAAA